MDVRELTEKDLAQAWSLWLSTGWNDKYRVNEREFARSWLGSFRTRCIVQQGRLVAMARSVSDGVMYAMIHDVVVDETYRGQGLGAAVIRALVDDLLDADIRCIQLMAAEDQSRFYEKLGFRPRPDNKPGMEYLPGT